MHRQRCVVSEEQLAYEYLLHLGLRSKPHVSNGHVMARLSFTFPAGTGGFSLFVRKLNFNFVFVP